MMNTPEKEISPFPRNPRILTARRIVNLVILSAIALVIWGLFFPHVNRTYGPVSLDQAKKCFIPLPNSAKNIQFYQRIHWIQVNEYVKFEAPVQDCLDHVQVVLDDWNEQCSDARKPLPLQPMKEPPKPFFHRTKDFGVDWFDPENIQEGMVAGGGGGPPGIWIDTQRGIFYYTLAQ